jgi:hypothetical protein
MGKKDTDTGRTDADERGEDLDEGEDLDSEGEDGDSEGEDGDTEEYAPPTKEEWEAAQRKLARVRREAQNLRKRVREGGDRTSGDGKKDQVSDGDQAVSETEKWRTRAGREHAKSELLSRGADKEFVGLLLASLRPDDIEWDDDEDPDVEDWIERMEEKYPRAFGEAASAAKPSAPAAKRPGRLNGAETSNGRRGPAGGSTLSFGEQIIAAGRSGTNARR